MNPSEKAGPAPARPIKTPRTRKSAVSKDKSIGKSNGDTEEAADQTSESMQEKHQKPPQPGGIESQPQESQTTPLVIAKNESIAFGWANSNKPMIKSDKRVPGVGVGRAGPRRSAASKYAGSGSDGNFVAYNLQRKGFKKGSFRSKRFGGSKFGSYGAGGPGTGRTMFDDESWRAEFDRDFDEATLAMAFTDGGLTVEDEEEDDDDIPWHGFVHDMTDPFVVTVSEKYLQDRIGDVDDPEEYIKELENKSREDKDDSLQEVSKGFKVNLEHILKKVWGYPSFRDGQLDSIKRALNYESSLLVLPTGSGKSLSYQLPAYIFSKLGVPCLTLVISPMISLMYDQVKCLPPGLTGACWTSVEQSVSFFYRSLA